MLSKIQKYSFLFSLLLLRFPPIYLFGIQHVAATSHIIATGILILLFFIAIPDIYKNKIIQITPELLLLSFFFFTQSVSVVAAINITAYANRFLKLSIGILVFFLLRYYLTKYKTTIFTHQILTVLLIGGFIAFILQILLYIFPEIYNQLGQLFIYNNVFSITETNYFVGKLFDDSYIEIVIPIIFYFIYIRTNLYEKILLCTFFIMMGILSFISNFRYRLVAFLFSLIYIFIIFRQKFNKYLFISLILIIPFILFFYLDSFLLQINDYSIVDRFLLEDEGDVNSITWRFAMYKTSMDLALHNFFGVGLGNFYDNLPQNYQVYSNPISKAISLGALTSGSHNIFFHTLAESGFIGLLSFILLIGYFGLKDIQIFQKQDIQKKVIVSCFWILMITVQFFPAINLTFYVLFFSLRALI